MANAISRREFVATSARLLLGAGFATGLLAAAGCGNSTQGSGPSALAWRDLAGRISGPVLRPFDPGYASLAQPNNLRYARILPAGIARCANAHDLAQAILWSRENGVPLAARAGGHSYAGYSTTTGLMIDLTLMNQVGFDPSTGQLTVGGGVRNGDLYAAMQAAGVRITHGRCENVGGAAFLLGGGIGFNMRALGLACDQMLATELVTADGTIVSANARSDSDLFWACQGGAGGNFGINTSFTLQSVAVPPSLTVFNITWTSNVESLYPALIEALAAAPTSLGSRVQLNAVTPKQFAAGNDVSVVLLGQLLGTPSDLAGILAPAYAAAAPATASIEQLAYWDAQLTFLIEPGPPAYYQERSRFFGPLSGAALATAIDWARRWPGTSKSADFVLFQTGGGINDIAADATAFVHRSSDWLMSIALNWSPADSPATLQSNLEWQAAAYAAMLNYTSQGAYQNFPDPSLTDYLNAYYGSNLSRLERIKAEVDPDLVFTFGQVIPRVFSPLADYTVQRRAA
jgi:FAD/FMN-containing dehydrogenase